MSASDDRSRAFGRRKELHRITIVHGDNVRAFHLDTGRIMAGALVVAVFGVAYLAATAYLFFRDDILTGSIARQVRMDRVYEDRVAGLRAEIDRINGRQLIDQDAFEAKIEKLIERQTRLTDTQARIGALVGRAADVGLQPPAPPKGPGLAPVAAPSPTTGPALVGPAQRPDPSETTGSVRPAPPPLDTRSFDTPLRSSRLSPFVTPAHAATGRVAGARDPAARIAGVEQAIDAFERHQTAAIATLADTAEARGRLYGRTLAKLGFRVSETPDPRPRPRPSEDGVGGPFVPADAVARAEVALGRLVSLRKAAARLPLARPLPGRPAITSEFGTRLDPFLGVSALHSGLDFRAETGDPVHATAPGTVIASGRQGGYGICVDVDHGNGVVTRYGHLSSASRAVGERVQTGDVVGLAGSTGRSTGPHLHYETRVSGEAVDPRDWLDAGRELGF